MVIFPEFYDKLLPPTKLDDDIFKTSNSAKSIIQSLTMIDGNFTVLDVLDVDEIDSTSTKATPKPHGLSCIISTNRRRRISY